MAFSEGRGHRFDPKRPQADDKRSNARPILSGAPFSHIFQYLTMQNPATLGHGLRDCVSLVWMTDQGIDAASRSNFSLSMGSLAWLPASPGSWPGSASMNFGSARNVCRLPPI